MSSEQNNLQQQLTGSNVTVTPNNPKQRRSFLLVPVDKNKSNSSNFPKSQNVTLLLHSGNILKSNLPVSNNASNPSQSSNVKTTAQLQSVSILRPSTFAANHMPGFSLDSNAKTAAKQHLSTNLRPTLLVKNNALGLSQHSDSKIATKFHSANILIPHFSVASNVSGSSSDSKEKNVAKLQLNIQNNESHPPQNSNVKTSQLHPVHILTPTLSVANNASALVQHPDSKPNVKFQSVNVMTPGLSLSSNGSDPSQNSNTKAAAHVNILKPTLLVANNASGPSQHSDAKTITKFNSTNILPHSICVANNALSPSQDLNAKIAAQLYPVNILRPTFLVVDNASSSAQHSDAKSVAKFLSANSLTPGLSTANNTSRSSENSDSKFATQLHPLNVSRPTFVVTNNTSSSAQYSNRENNSKVHSANTTKDLSVPNNASSSSLSDTNVNDQSSETFIAEHNYGANLEESDEEDEILKPFVCSACGKSFLYHCSMKRHIRKFHSNNSALLEPPQPKKNLMYPCDKCNYKFSDKRNLAYHKRRIHGSLQYNHKKFHICPICQSGFKKREMMKHLTVDHGINLKMEELRFLTFENFMSWKWDLEIKTESRYIIHHHYNQKSGVKTLHFVCQRSGNFETKSKGLRRLKKQGSAKMNAFCPAAIYFTEQNDGTCTVDFWSTHVGHHNNLGHLSEINNDLRLNISAETSIFDTQYEINDSNLESILQQYPLLTKSDFKNIEKSFFLNFGQDIKYANDRENVDIWMQELQNCQNSCVLFYKAQGQNSDISYLNNDDFLLIIMTTVQEEILKKFSTNCLCIDRTHEVNSYGYELITLLALDSLQRGLPCAFLITNTTDEISLSIFFQCLKHKVGELQPKFFMSDVENSFCSSWMAEMGMPQKHFFCTWHVDWCWKKNLIKINGKEKQLEVYRILKPLLYEQDIKRFNHSIKAAVAHLNEDPDIKEFASYFKMHYEQTITAWASCYKIQSGLNINWQLEKMHQALKYIYLCEKYSKRPDLAMYCIMRFIKNKMMARLMISNKRKLTNKVTELAYRHKASTLMSSQVLLNKNGWLVSCENNELHYIQEVIDICTCQIICPECNICIHRYSCSCFDSSIKWNMCKHVHFLCYSQNLNCHTTNEDIIKEQHQESKVPALTIEEQREAFKRKFSDLIDSLTYTEQFTVMERNVKSLESRLNVIKLKFANQNCKK